MNQLSEVVSIYPSVNHTAKDATQPTNLHYKLIIRLDYSAKLSVCNTELSMYPNISVHQYFLPLITSATYANASHEPFMLASRLDPDGSSRVKCAFAPFLSFTG